jgi:hypothetical protein
MTKKTKSEPKVIEMPTKQSEQQAVPPPPAIVLFSFCYDPLTQRATMQGNVDAVAALQLLQQIVLTAMQQQLKQEEVQNTPNP